MSSNSKITASGKKTKLSGAQCRKLKAERHAKVMKNSQSIKQFLAKSTSKPCEGDISLGNNTNEAVDISDYLSSEKQIEIPPKSPLSLPPKSRRPPTQERNSKSDDYFSLFSEVRDFSDSKHPDDYFSLGMFEYIILTPLLYY